MKKFRMPAILLAIVLLFSLVPGGLADLGSFSGNSDFGSSDWGSSSSWSSSDWGSSDWGSSSSWGSGSSSWSSSPSYSYYGGSSSSYGGGVFFGGSTLFIIFLVLIVIIIISRRSNSSSTNYTVPEGAKPTEQSKLTAMSAYTALDPNFSSDLLRERLGNLYVQMQHAWTNKDLSALRPYFTDALYNQYARQLELYVTAERTNYVDRIAILGTTLRGYFQQDGYDHIIVEMRTRIVDYDLDDNTGELVSGSKTTEKFMTYEWDIARKSGIVTKEEAEIRTVNCPNCGAPLSINTTAHCPYCDSVVTVENEDWAIVNIKAISQRSR